MTPYRNALESSPEAHFNTVHSKARSIVERCIGLFKARFRVLMSERQSRYSPLKVGKMVNICAALHNICIHYKVPINFIWNVVENDPNYDDFNNYTPPQLLRIANQKRNFLRDTLA